MGGYRNKITRQPTLITDLTLTEKELMSSFKKNTRYEIRRAEREGVETRFYNGNDVSESFLNRFSETYKKMYATKGMKRGFNTKLVREYCKSDSLSYSYIYDDKNSRFFYSCSLFRENKDESALIGWANRYLHWQDFLYLRKQGISTYDWGGINDIENPDNIALFKMSFCGEPINTYNYVLAKTAIGVVAHLAMFR